MPVPQGTTALYAGPPTDDILFQSNIRVGGTTDWYGFGGAYLANTNCWTHVDRAGAGPHGQDAVEFQLVGGETAPSDQFTFGPVKSGFAQPAQGSRRVIRWRIKAKNPMEWTSMPSGGRWGNKFIILGQPDGGEGSGQAPAGRMIANIGRFEDEPLDEWHIACEKGVEGNGGPNGDTLILVQGLSAEVWYSCQWVIDFSSTSSAFDAVARLFINDDNASFSTPTGVTGAWKHDCAEMGSLFGLGQYAGVAYNTASINFQVCDVEYGTTFDATWGD